MVTPEDKLVLKRGAFSKRRLALVSENFTEKFLPYGSSPTKSAEKPRTLAEIYER
jgi:hypothetical protein